MSRYLKIGLFVTAVGIGTVLYVMETAERVGNGQTYTVHAYVPDATGLLLDSSVRLAGVEVGRLRNIELDGNRARLTLEIRRDVQLYEDAVIAKETQSMLGTATVAIDPGTGRGAMLSDGAVISNVRQQASISDAVGNANLLAANAADLVGEISTYLQDEETVAALNEIVQVTRETVVATSELLEQNLELARSSMQNIESFSVRLDAQSVSVLQSVQDVLDTTVRIAERLDSLVDDNDESVSRSIDELEQSIDSLRTVMASFEQTADNVEVITQRVRDGEGNVGRLLAEDQLYERIVNVTGQAEEFLDATIGLGIQVGFQSEYLTQQLSTKDRFELRLVPDPERKYYSVGVVSVPGLEERGADPEDSKELLFNLQLARTWGPLTVRAGVLESTGGVGMDLRPVNQLELSAEAFDFGADDGVYLRGYGTVYPFYDPESNNPLNWLYLAGGVDDAMNVYRRDYFVGAGVRFSDRDLRGLIGFVPVN